MAIIRSIGVWGLTKKQGFFRVLVMMRTMTLLFFLVSINSLTAQIRSANRAWNPYFTMQQFPLVGEEEQQPVSPAALVPEEVPHVPVNPWTFMGFPEGLPEYARPEPGIYFRVFVGQLSNTWTAPQIEWMFRQLVNFNVWVDVVGNHYVFVLVRTEEERNILLSLHKKLWCAINGVHIFLGTGQNGRVTVEIPLGKTSVWVGWRS